MSFQHRTLGVAAIGSALLLLLLTALYQRVANPELVHHFDHPQQTAPTAEAPPTTLPSQEAEALSRAMSALKNAPANPDALMEVAEIFARNRDWDKAIPFLTQATTAAPNDIRPWFYLGAAQAGKKSYAEAAHSLEHVLIINPGVDRARFNLAILYRYHLSQPEKATELLKAIVASPTAEQQLKEHAQKELNGL